SSASRAPRRTRSLRTLGSKSTARRFAKSRSVLRSLRAYDEGATFEGWPHAYALIELGVAWERRIDPMKNMARIAASLGVLAAACAGASAIVAGCGGDDTEGGGDASTDTTTDAPHDALPPNDASGEASAEDAGDAGIDAADAADTSIFP